MHKKLRSTLAAVHKTWISEYFSFLARKDSLRQSNSPFTKSQIKPHVGDWVLIKDNTKDLRLGTIKDLLKSDDGETRKALVKTEHFEGIYPITNLRFLECHQIPEDKLVPSSNTSIKSKPRRQAAIVATEKLKTYLNK